MIVVFHYFLAVVLSVLTTIFGGLCNSWIDFYIPILLFIGYLLGGFLVSLILMFITAIPIKVKSDFCEKHSKFYRFIFDNALELVLYICRVKVILEGKEKIPQKGRFIIMSNHMSKFDCMVINKAFKGYDISWVGKRSLFKMPFIGKIMHKICCLPLDRDNVRQGLKVIKQCAYYINEDMCSIAICPEGTRNNTEDILLPLKAGSMKMAYYSKAPILVVECVNTEKIVKRSPFRRTRVYIKISKVLEYEDFKDIDTTELASLIEKEMRDVLVEQRKKKA